MDNYLSLRNLNEAQRKAVEYVGGPMMVIAGAGSGKTRVLTYRIVHLINLGIDPFNILSLTFTNKAAHEMRERIEGIVGDNEAKNLWMGTFHSIFARILRVEAQKIGYPSSFTIYDTQDSKSLIKTIIKEMGLDDKIYKPNLVYNRISSAKNSLISVQAYKKSAEIVGEDRMSGKPRISEIYEAYSKRCFKSGAMDFDDLLFKTNELLKDHPDVLYKYQEKFQFLLVDEYQDTNYSQYLIVKKLAARHENICVVGDDAQSIYAFRGANIQNILNFKSDYPDYQLFKLEQNYRSTKNIVEAANSIISRNSKQIKKEVWTANSSGQKIKVLKALTDGEEGYMIANSIFKTKMDLCLTNDKFAILYRTNAQSRSLEEALRKLNIDYKIYGGLSFYQRKEIKDLLAYFRFTVNPNDEEALKRIINYPKRAIGQTSIDKLILTARENDQSIWEVIENINEFETGINKPTTQRIYDFCLMIKSFRAMMADTNAYDLAEHIAKSSRILGELFNDKTPEGISRYENIQELLNGIKDFSDKNETDNSLTDFLIDVALLTDADQEDEDDKDKVSLMTIHAAKGLEFPYVYIVGLEENLFPSQLSVNSREDLEEERRLFYVALTRAEKAATLSYATSRYKWGNLNSSEPSRFIEEIDPIFLELPETKKITQSTGSFGNKFNTSTQNPSISVSRNLKKIQHTSSTSFSGDDLTKIKVGVRVEHARFGKGKIIAMEGNPPNVKATVFFPEVGQKQLLLKFAKLKILKD